MTPLFSIGSWSLNLTNTCWRVLLPLKCVCIPYLAHTFLMLSPRPWMYWMSIVLHWVFPWGVYLCCFCLSCCLLVWCCYNLGVVVTISLLVVVYKFILYFVNGPPWVLTLTKAFLRCCNSSLRSSGVVHTVLALWVSVATLYLAERLWWLSHCKCWSVWVGFQYTVILNELSASGLTKVSGNRIAPVSWLPSTVNFIAGSMLLMWSRNNCLWVCCNGWQMMSSTNLNQNLGGWRKN